VVIPQQALPPATQELPSGRHASQEQPPTPHVLVSPENGSAQERPLQHPVAPLHDAPTVPQVLQVPASQTSPTQQSADVPQLCVAALQESQMQPAPPEQIVLFGATQVSAGLWLQHWDVLVQEESCGWQTAGTAHFPAMHCSVGALQQSVFVRQFPPVAAQVLADSQVPAVAVGGITQVKPAQQSSPVVQVWWRLEHGAAQKPPTQLEEQQSLATAQACPLGLHEVGVSQLKVPVPLAKVQTVPEQQLESSAPRQAPCSAVQVGCVQRRTPTASGMHGAKLQH
jgi:hypothetical protein